VFSILGSIVIPICIGVAIAWVILLQARARRKPVYVKRKTLFTKAERMFLSVLDEAVGGELRAFGKVRIADLVCPRAGLAEKGRKKALYRVSSKHVDFVLCGKHGLEPVCVVELDDASHRAPSRRERDLFVDNVLQSAGLPVVRFPVRTTYAVDEIHSTIRRTIEQANTDVPSVDAAEA